MLSFLKSRSHCSAYNKPKASPRGTEHLGEKLIVLANTKEPSSSLIHTPNLVLFRELEKEASILHFNLPDEGRCQTVSFEADEELL
jgi:hypothetical protein